MEIVSFVLTTQRIMARRLDPKFSEKNIASEKIVLIRKNSFASEKT